MRRDAGGVNVQAARALLQGVGLDGSEDIGLAAEPGGPRHHAGGGDAGGALQLGNEIEVLLQPDLWGGEIDRLHRSLGIEHLGRVVAPVIRVDVAGGPVEQAGADCENGEQGDLAGHHEAAPHAATGAAVGSGALADEFLGMNEEQIHQRRNGGDGHRDQGQRHRHGGMVPLRREQQPIGRDDAGHGAVHRRGRGQQHRVADPGGDEGEREQLKTERAHGRAPRHSEGQQRAGLGRAAEEIDHHEVRCIGAADDDEEQREREERERTLVHVGQEVVFAERLHRSLELVLADQRQCGDGAVENLLQVGLGARGGDAGFEATDDVEAHVVAGLGEGMVAERLPHLLLVGEAVGLRHDAHDGRGFAVDVDQLPDDVRIAGEFVAPGLLGQEHDAGAAELVLVGREQPALERTRVGQAERGARDVGTQQALGAAVGLDEDGLVEGDGGEIGEHGLPLVPDVEIRERH